MIVHLSIRAWRRLAFPALIGVAVWSLVGCSHMPASSILTLARLDLRTTDPEKLRLALKLPPMLRARTEATVLRITVRLANGIADARDFSLREIDDRQGLASEGDAVSHISTYALAVADVARMRAFRAGLMEKQRGGSGGSITIAVRPDTCRTGPLPGGPVLFTTYLKTAETNGYVVLARDVDLRRVDSTRDLAAAVPVCGS